MVDVRHEGLSGRKDPATKVVYSKEVSGFYDGFLSRRNAGIKPCGIMFWSVLEGI